MTQQSCENRLLNANKAGGGYDGNTYNGLGCRVANHDFAGNYTNKTDGVSATSAVLNNGVEMFTPGYSSQDMTGSGSLYYTEPDQIGTTLGMSNSSQAQVYNVEYDAFGDIAGTTGGFTSTYAFLNGYAGQGGYQTDRDTGFIRCGNRYYSPYFGRFITQDPAGAGSNWYAYCGNDPTGRTDPTGLYPPGVSEKQNPGGLENEQGDTTGLEDLLLAGYAPLLNGIKAGIEIGNAQISGTPDFVLYTYGLLQTIGGSGIGASLLASMWQDGNVLQIAFYNSFQTGHPNDGYDPPSDTILFDPALSCMVDTAYGPESESPVELLEHEIGHDATGLVDPPDGYGKCDGSDNISVNEDPFRNYMGGDDRIDHSGLPNGGPQNAGDIYAYYNLTLLKRFGED